MPSTDKLSNYRTTIASRNGNTCVTYSTTVIVEFDAECIILRTGGWRSVTTKRKMNQAANQFDLGYSVSQIAGDWFVRTSSGEYEFSGDAVKIDRATGRVTEFTNA